VTVDLRGFGESSAAVEPTTMERMADDTMQLMDALHTDALALGGLSLGGYVAFQCVSSASQRLRGLILADTRPGADSPETRAARETTAEYAEQHGSAALLERDAPRLFSAATQALHHDIVERAREIAALNSALGVASASRGMGLRPDSTGLLPGIRCPALVIVGEQDTITPVAEARTMFERIPNAQLEIIAGAGHLSNLEQPEAFTGLVVRFMQQLK
jgi:pimeloyl-ACP methyl ester carboxylesterase